MARVDVRLGKAGTWAGKEVESLCNISGGLLLYATFPIVNTAILYCNLCH